MTKKSALTKSGNRPTSAPPVIEFMPDGSCNGYFPGRRMAFTIPEPLVMAVWMVLEGKESYTREVTLMPDGGSDDDVWCALCIKDVCFLMNEMELEEFADAFISARLSLSTPFSTPEF